ncbi:septal ring lytic transglycosylase RlpA family protein [Bradyrhizobium sp. 132]|uniref:septal ring lytic transglycosylase RlpA family protein n=1 Tax=Bradyrhizobium sp. 132 TaxID=2782610 RepID=UPI001FFA2633|nr:septal ring lytic transglycosylase RlpA family protein [Bradyrhizobium sp. 132]MCK1781208.1 septal ring lytic transglycosylase RlpA family protein [Bradyrhizobium sp. 132]
MRLFSGMIVIATVCAWTGLHPTPAVGQTFNDRWSIIPKAHAEPAPEGLDQIKKDEPQAQPPNRQEPLNDRSGIQSFNRVFSGKASYYSYSKGKTASGSSIDRNQLTAAHRRLPFGTRVRVLDLETNKSVVVRITDRGPWVRGRVLDLSLAAARTLGITDRGVAQVRAEVL